MGPDVLKLILGVLLAAAWCALIAFMLRWRLWWLGRETLFFGQPRRSRAIARVLARRSSGRNRVAAVYNEASALFWQGRFERSMALIDARVAGTENATLRLLALMTKVECLLLEERIPEAKALYAEHGVTLRALREASSHATAAEAILHFYDGDLNGARDGLEKVLVQTTWRDPIARVAHFWLAAIAFRQARRDDVRMHLGAAIVDGGDLFIARWAVSQWEALFPGEEMPRRSVPAPKRTTFRPLRHLLGHLWIGLEVLCFRTASLERRRYRGDHIAGLVLFSVCVGLGLRLVGYQAGAHFSGYAAIQASAPLLAFFLTAFLAVPSPGRREATVRILGGFYGALPALLVLAFAAVQVSATHATAGQLLELLTGGWALAIVIHMARSVGRASVGWLTGSAIMFVVTCLLPWHAVGRSGVFYTVTVHDDHGSSQRWTADLMFAQADRLDAAEAILAPERPGVADLYFVGAALWARQDVFLREVESARQLLDRQFDTKGRSVILANDLSATERHPLAASTSLRRMLAAVGARMNPQEDILFLLVTSHGTEDGLALSFPPNAPFPRELLRPNQLRTMLDDAGIQWRVLVIAGCKTGVFIEPLQTEHTLIATAAADDRVAYGCASGNPFTDFGRALFAEVLPKERSFVTAFNDAAALADKWDTEQKRRASHPRIFEGAAIGDKLRALEQRLP